MNIISIKIDPNGALSFDGDRLATVQEYVLSDRSIASIFCLLSPSQWIELAEGIFQLDLHLNLYFSVNSDPQIWILKSVNSVEIKTYDRAYHPKQL